jgi:hypothetical protein
MRSICERKLTKERKQERKGKKSARNVSYTDKQVDGTQVLKIRKEKMEGENTVKKSRAKKEKMPNEASKIPDPLQGT